MFITFGVPLTPGYDRQTLQNLVDSIQFQDSINDFEIILCGEYRYDIAFCSPPIVIPFDESERPKWITKKKNRIVERANFGTLCILHDYYLLEDNWYNGLLEFNEYCDWSIATNRTTTKEGRKHSDWLVNQKYMDIILEENPGLGEELMRAEPHENNGPRWVCGLPYTEFGLKHLQYISGGYILAKTYVFRDTPFDERYVWGEAAEDIIWSEAVIEKGHRFHLNPYSFCTLQKPGKWRVGNMTRRCIDLLRKRFGEFQ